MMLQGLSKIGYVLHFMLLPAHNGWLGEFCYAILETLAMAFVGMLCAGMAAVPLGYLVLAGVMVVVAASINYTLKRRRSALHPDAVLVTGLVEILSVVERESAQCTDLDFKRQLMSEIEPSLCVSSVTCRVGCARVMRP
jgi:hypothetical protein